MSKWDYRFISLAAHIAQWSKDPRTKTGAVIADRNNRIVSVGFNGLPTTVRDLPQYLDNREEKLEMIIHCEVNAILFANRGLYGCTLYTYPFASCSRCASIVAQSGIRRVVAPELAVEADHWMHKSLERTRLIFAESMIEFTTIPHKDIYADFKSS